MKYWITNNSFQTTVVGIGYFKNIQYLLLFLIASAIGNQLHAQSSQPNIIFILTDDHRNDMVGYANHPILKTPNIDSLATQGTIFKNTFVTTPVCSPSRASILTGVNERTHGRSFDTPPLGKQFKKQTYPYILKKHGYHTGFIGKFDVPTEKQFEREIFDHFSHFRANFYWRLKGKGRTEHIHLTQYTTEKAIDFINKSPKNKPFCLSLSYNAPHAEDYSPDQYIPAPSVAHFYKNDHIAPPLLYKPSDFEKLPQFIKEGMNRLRWHWRFDTPDKYQESMKGYYRMITGVDDAIGLLRHHLDTLGIADHTILIFMGDNGMFYGDRGLAGKWLLYDQALRVPLVIYDPRLLLQSTSIQAMTLNLDIAPTILDFAGAKISKKYQGKSLVPLLVKGEQTLRDYFICENLMKSDVIPKVEGIRTERYKYFRYLDYEVEEFYDLKNDPLERNNLISNDSLKAIIDDLKLTLATSKF